MILPLLLTSCGQENSNVCPPLVAYSPTLQGQAAGELTALPPGAVLRGMIADYGALRAMARACAAPAK